MSDTPRTDAIITQTERKSAGYALALVSDVAHQLERELAEARKDAERYRWMKECTNEQFAYLEKEWCGLDNAIDCLMAVERDA